MMDLNDLSPKTCLLSWVETLNHPWVWVRMVFVCVSCEGLGPGLGVSPISCPMRAGIRSSRPQQLPPVSHERCALSGFGTFVFFFSLFFPLHNFFLVEYFFINLLISPLQTAGWNRCGLPPLQTMRYVSIMTSSYSSQKIVINVKTNQLIKKVSMKKKFFFSWWFSRLTKETIFFRSDIEVRLGEHDIWEPDGTEQHIMSAKFIPHPNYGSDGMDSDIMLIKLSRPAILNRYVQPAVLPSKCASDGTMCQISGWGNIRPSNEGCELYMTETLQWCSRYYHKLWPRTRKDRA